MGYDERIEILNFNRINPDYDESIALSNFHIEGGGRSTGRLRVTGCYLPAFRRAGRTGPPVEGGQVSCYMLAPDHPRHIPKYKQYDGILTGY